MLSLGHKLSKKYATNGIIDSEYIDSYAYIFDYIFNFALYNFTLILIGFILHKSAITITYVIITGYLRAVAGGYHCKRHITCTILSYTVFALYISLNTIVSTIPIYISLLIFVISWVLILIISPVDTPNRPFTDTMKKAAKRRVLILFIGDSVFTFFSFLLHWNKVIYSNVLSLTVCITGLYAGYILNSLKLHKFINK